MSEYKTYDEIIQIVPCLYSAGDLCSKRCPLRENCWGDLEKEVKDVKTSEKKV